MARAFPASRFAGYDISRFALDRAGEQLAASGLTNAEFHDPRDEPLPDDGSLTFVTTFDCLHDMTDPDGIARRIRAALADDGTWLVADIKAYDTFAENVERNPMAALMYGTSVLSCMSSALSEPGGAGLGTLGMSENRARQMAEAGRVHAASARSTSTARSTPSTRSDPDGAGRGVSPTGQPDRSACAQRRPALTGLQRAGGVARQVDDVAGAEAVVGPHVVGRHVLGAAGERGVALGRVARPGLHGVGVGPGAHDEPGLDERADAVGVADRVVDDHDRGVGVVSGTSTKIERSARSGTSAR